MSLPPTEPPLMTNVKMEDVVAEMSSKSAFELSSSGRNVNEQLQIAMKYLCTLYEVPVQSLLNAVKQSGEDINEVVHALIFDLPYNSRQIVELSNSEYHSTLIGLSTHGLIFRSLL